MKSSKVHYTHSLSYTAKDRLVGTFVVIALVAVLGLFVAKVKTSKLFDDVVHYQTFMKNAQGISTETIINISGIDVGKVTSIKIAKNNRVHITFFIYKEFQKLLRADSTGELNKLSLVGNAMIIIKAGTPELSELPDGATITVEEPVTTDDLIAGITPVIKNMESLISDLSKIINAIDPEAVKTTTQDVKALMSNVRDLSDHVNKGQGSLGRILYDKRQEESVNSSLLMLEKTIKGIANRVNETKPILKNVNKLSLESEKMIVDLRQSIKRLDNEIKQLPALMNSTQEVLDNSNQTLKGLQKVWPLSSTIKPANEKLLIDEGLDD
ncbi:MAG: MCE family protein [Methylococcaceae bacterium]|nr:MCE family protein [Methylococcaceae bacterium]